MPLETRLLNDSEYKAVNDFYNSTSHIGRPAPSIPRSYSDFCWEFIACPNGKALYAGAWEIEEGKDPVLVGVQSVIILKMISADGAQSLCAKGEGTLIDIKAIIKFKKTDILRELFDILIVECQKKGVQFLWGFNNIPASYHRLGFENPFKSYHGTLVLKPFKAYQNIVSLRSKKSALDNFKIAVFSGLSSLLSIQRTFLLSKINSYSVRSEIDENQTLFQKAASAGELIFLLQDEEYLKWKISQNPYPITYRSYQFTDANNSLMAQIICGIQKDVAFIEQTLFDKQLDKKTIRSFLKSILRSLKKENICLVRYTGFRQNDMNAREMDLLKSLGFIFTGKGEWFTFKNLSDHSDLRPENIYLSRLYKQGVN